MYYGPEAADWFRVKANPYVRVVSSYLFMTSHLNLFRTFLPSSFFTVQLANNNISPSSLDSPANSLPFSGSSSSFFGFVKHLSNLTTLQLQYYAHSHAGIQSKPYERHFYYASGNKTSLFHEILYLEHLEEGIKRLNEATGMNFTNNEQFKHSSKDNIVNSRFTFCREPIMAVVEKRISSDYKHFYNLK
jgi:hypothetical protein